MKVIDLLNKIANGEHNFRFKYERFEYFWDFDSKHFIDTEFKELFGERYALDFILNDEVEIIEEDKKIEKIDLSEWAEITYQEDWEMLTKDFNRNCNLFVNKINKIIDYLEENKK